MLVRSDRQTTRNHFEARVEYVRQVAKNNQAVESSVKEYGLQTLKWLFLFWRRTYFPDRQLLRRSGQPGGI
jgi:hypothetical protein